MTLWSVSEEFVPLDGAAALSDADLETIASKVRVRFANHAHGSGNRFVASAKFEAAESKEAEAWGRQVFFGFIGEELPGWRLELLDVWRP